MDTSNNTYRQYGLWTSPITPLGIARGISFSDIAWDQDGTLVWLEMRSDRGVLVIQPPNGEAPRDLNSDLSIRAKVGYGGGDFAVSHGNVYFAEADSGRLYTQPIGHGTAHSITPAFGQYASPTISPDGKWLIFIHSYEAEDSIGIVDNEGKLWPQKLVSGNDFYMQPAWHPDGQTVAWIAWDHPNMPWDGTSLYLGKLKLSNKGLPILDEAIKITGEDNISIFQPEFSPDGRYLAYVSDAAGWWQLYLYDLDRDNHHILTKEDADYGLPAWIQGLRTYVFSPSGDSIYCLRNKLGINSLWKINIDSNEMVPISLPEVYTELRQVSISHNNDELALLASGVQTPPRVITLSSASSIIHVKARSRDESLDPSLYSALQTITWQGMDNENVYGLLYEPSNPEFHSSGKPPLIVNIHGGPTSQRGAAFNIGAQFFTSRGYAYLEVNYRGSTGYGRPYWEALKSNWGIYDVQDAVYGAQFLVDQGKVDNKRLVIMGGSAGGFTVLKAMEDYPGFFKAGVCLYGVANQFTLVADTHKFESHYSDTLLGSLPDASDIYYERSPVFHADNIQDPIIIFQGEDDKVVPRSQSDDIVSSLQKRGIPHEYHLYPGEGHGFRKTDTIEDFYKNVQKFLTQYVIYS